MAEQFGVPDVSGALVNDVTPGSPADKAGIKAGDVIRTFDGKPIDSKDALTFMVASGAPGHGGHARHPARRQAADGPVTLGSRPANLGVRHGAGEAPDGGHAAGDHRAEPRPRSSASSSASPPRPRASSSAGSIRRARRRRGASRPATSSRRSTGKPVRNVADFDRLAADATGEVLLRIVRQGVALFVVLSPLDNGGQ